MSTAEHLGMEAVCVCKAIWSSAASSLRREQCVDFPAGQIRAQLHLVSHNEICSTFAGPDTERVVALTAYSSRFPLAGNRDGALATTVDDRRQGKGAALLSMHPDATRSYACKDYIFNTSFHRTSRFHTACNRSCWQRFIVADLHEAVATESGMV